MCTTQIAAISMPEFKDFRGKFTAGDSIFFFRGETKVWHDNADALKKTYY